LQTPFDYQITTGPIQNIAVPSIDVFA
jgi:hypothetical protein